MGKKERILELKNKLDIFKCSGVNKKLKNSLRECEKLTLIIKNNSLLQIVLTFFSI